MMKKIINPCLAIIILVTFLFAACKKTGPELFSPNRINYTTPVPNAGKDTIIILPVNSILLDGSGSTDKENDIVSYQWKLLYGPSTISILTPVSSKTVVENLVGGTYQFELTVTDKIGLSSNTVVSVMVLDPHILNFKIASDTSVQLPFNLAYLTVAGYGSINTIYKWEKISGPNSFRIESNNSPWTRVSNLVSGVYEFEITVTYSNVYKEKDTMMVTVLPDNNVYSSEKIFENISWVCFEGCTTTIYNISSFIPPGHHFLVYFKLDEITDWELVRPLQFNADWSFPKYILMENNFLRIDQYSDRNADTYSKIKIVY